MPININELRSKTNSELLAMLLRDDSNDANIKRVLNERHFILQLNNMDEEVQRARNQHQQAAHRHIKDITPTLNAVWISKTKSVSACYELTQVGWDYTDPLGLMNKDPDEIVDFLNSMRYEIATVDQMHPSRAALLKVIVDAYTRALSRQHGH